jgi:hypothetical protein
MTPWALVMAALLTGCADPVDTGVGQDLDERACAFIGVTGMTISAVSDIDVATLASIEPSDEPWTIALGDGARSWLRFELTEPAHLRLYMDQAGVLRDLHDEGGPMGLPAGEALGGCADAIPEYFRLNLGQPGTYHLELAPGELSELWLMLMDPSVL